MEPPGRVRRWRNQLLGPDVTRPTGFWGLGHRFMTLVLLAYVGGGVMFTVHALVRREKGPPISNLDHWLLDSTLGFIALAPVVLVGFALLARSVPARSRRFPVVAGVAFAVITTPGPILHDHIVGENTLGASLAVRFCGLNHAALARHGLEHSAISECLVQLAVGIPTYIGLVFVAWAAGVAVCSLGWFTTRRPRFGSFGPVGQPRWSGVLRRSPALADTTLPPPPRPVGAGPFISAILGTEPDGALPGVGSAPTAATVTATATLTTIALRRAQARYRAGDRIEAEAAAPQTAERGCAVVDDDAHDDLDGVVIDLLDDLGRRSHSAPKPRPDRGVKPVTPSR